MSDILNTAEGAPAPEAITPAANPPASPPASGEGVTPAAPPVVNQPVETKDEATGIVTYTPTGHVGLDLSLEFFGKLGLSFDSPEMQEAGKGNFTYLEAKLATLGDKAAGSERYLALAKEAYEQLKQSDIKQTEERKKTVFDAVGGEENWKQISEFVKANAEPEELEQVRDGLTQGGIVAKALAVYLKNMHASATGTVVQPASPVHNQATAPAGGAPLTLQGYRQELNGLVAKIGSNNLDGSPEYAALRKKYANVK